MSEQTLRELVDRLKQEVDGLPAQEVETRDRLNGIIADLEGQLEAPAMQQSQGLTGNIQDTIHELEVRHPDATTVLNNIMMTLANMGI